MYMRLTMPKVDTEFPTQDMLYLIIRNALKKISGQSLNLLVPHSCLL